MDPGKCKICDVGTISEANIKRGAVTCTDEKCKRKRNTENTKKHKTQRTIAAAGGDSNAIVTKRRNPYASIGGSSATNSLASASPSLVSAQGIQAVQSTTCTKRQATTNLEKKERATIKRWTTRSDGSTTREEEVKESLSTSVTSEQEFSFKVESSITLWKREEINLMEDAITRLSDARALDFFLETRVFKDDDMGGYPISKWTEPPLVDDQKSTLLKYANLGLGECLTKHRGEWIDLAKEWSRMTRECKKQGLSAAAGLWKGKYLAANTVLGGQHPITTLAYQALTDFVKYIKNRQQEPEDDDDDRPAADDGDAAFCGVAFEDLLYNYLPTYYAKHPEAFAHNCQILLQMETCNDYQTFENMLLSDQVNLRFRTGLPLNVKLREVEDLVDFPLSTDTRHFPYFHFAPLDMLTLLQCGSTVTHGELPDSLFVCNMGNHVIYLPSPVAVRVFKDYQDAFRGYVNGRWIKEKYEKDNKGDYKGTTFNDQYFSGKILSNKHFAPILSAIEQRRQQIHEERESVCATPFRPSRDLVDLMLMRSGKSL